MDRLKALTASVIAVLFILTSSPALCADNTFADILFGGELSGKIGMRYKLEDESGESESDFQIETALDYTITFSNSLEAVVGLRTGSFARPTRGWVNHELFFEENTFYMKPWTLTHTGSIRNCEVETTIGAFEYPFGGGGGGGIIFDNDVIKPGISQEFNFDLDGPNLDIGWSAMYLQNGELHGDTWLVAGNVEFDLYSDKNRTASMQVSYIDYLNEDTISQAINEERLIVSGHAPNDSTNNTISNYGEFPGDFGILFIRLEQDWDGDVPVSAWYEYVNNVRADNSDGARNEAYSLGLEFGDAANAGDWEVGGCWLVIEDDAVLELYNKGKYGTNVRGFTASVNYRLFDDVELFLDGYWLRTNALRDEIDPFNARIFQIGIEYEF